MVSGANNKVDIFIDTISILFLMLWSGGGFTYGLWPLWMIVLFPFLFILYKKRGCCLNKKIVIVTFMLTFIALLQTLSFSGDFNTTTKYLLALYSVMIMSCYLFKSRHFVDLYIKVTIQQ